MAQDKQTVEKEDLEGTNRIHKRNKESKNPRKRNKRSPLLRVHVIRSNEANAQGGRVGGEETNTHAEYANLTQCETSKSKKPKGQCGKRHNRQNKRKEKRYVGPACPFSAPDTQERNYETSLDHFKQQSSHLSQARRLVNGARATRNEKAGVGSRLEETQTYQNCSARRTR